MALGKRTSLPAEKTRGNRSESCNQEAGRPRPQGQRVAMTSQPARWWSKLALPVQEQALLAQEPALRAHNHLRERWSSDDEPVEPVGLSVWWGAAACWPPRPPLETAHRRWRQRPRCVASSRGLAGTRSTSHRNRRPWCHCTGCPVTEWHTSQGPSVSSPWAKYGTLQQTFI